MIASHALLAFPVSDMERSRNFYEESLGLQRLAIGPACDWADYDLGGLRLRLYVHTGPYQRQHSGQSFFVEDIQRVVTYLKSRGVHFRSGIRDEPWGGRMITLADPDGNLFDLLDRTYADQFAAT